MVAQVIFAGGCFWCTEAVFLQIAGVRTVQSGYIGGAMDNPDYKSVCSGQTGHAEAILIGFDEAAVSWDDLAAIFFATHDPTQLNRQGNDIGTQYRSAIFVADEAERSRAELAIARAQNDWPQPIVTRIENAARWWPAEDYHQDYWAREGARNPYCLALIPPKLQKLKKTFAKRLKDGA